MGRRFVFVAFALCAALAAVAPLDAAAADASISLDGAPADARSSHVGAPADASSSLDGESDSAHPAGSETPHLADDVPLFTGVADTVDVVSDRPDRADIVSCFATVHALEGRVDRVSCVSDVIESGAGVNVRRYGGLGSYSTASVRASSPGQVEVYLDGIPLNSAQWGAVNLADLPLGPLARIEVYRSGSPVEFGAAGVGGTINLVTRTGGEGPSFAALSGGSYGTYRLDVFASGRSEIGECSVAFHELQSEGDFEYLDRHGTPENEDDDEVVERVNNDFRQSDVLVRLRTEPVEGWGVELSNESFNKRSGVPGTENVHITSVHYRVFRNAARLSITPPRMLDDELSIAATGFHVFRRDRFYNPDDEVGFDRWDSDDRAWTYGANILARYDWRAALQSFSLLAESRRDRFVPESVNPSVGVGFTRRRSEYSLNAEDHLFLPWCNAELVAAYRYRESSDNYTGPPPIGGPPEPLEEPHRTSFGGPSLGARWNLVSNATLKVNRTEYARFPSMVELFGASGYIEGNSELDPEQGVTTDAGLTLRFDESPGDDLLVECVVFWADREDLILFLQNSQRTVKAFNLERARVEGVEIIARRDWAWGLSVSASYTFQDARNEGPSPTYNGKRLPYEPVHAFFARTEWDAGRFSAWHEFHYQGETYRDRANLEENLSPASRVHSIGASLDIVPGALSVSAEVQNVTDGRVMDVEGYPLPGRTYYVTLAVGDYRQ